MAIFYSDNSEPYKGPPRDYYEEPATRFYLTHYNNYLILDAIVRAPKTPGERRDAAKELTICERKMAHWRRHPNFDQVEAGREVARLKTAWRR